MYPKFHTPARTDRDPLCVARRFITPLALGGSLAFPAALAAQEAPTGERAFSLAAGAGATVSGHSDLGTGYHLALSAELRTAWRPLRLRVEGLVSRAAFDGRGQRVAIDPTGQPYTYDDGHVEGRAISGATVSAVAAVGSGRAVAPYVLAGVGYYTSPWSTVEPRGHNVGLTGGLGATFSIGRRAFFAEVRAHQFGNLLVRGSDKVIFPVTIGARF